MTWTRMWECWSNGGGKIKRIKGASCYDVVAPAAAYFGKDSDGVPTFFLFTLTAVTGHHTIYTICQTVTDTKWEVDIWLSDHMFTEWT